MKFRIVIKFKENTLSIYEYDSQFDPVDLAIQICSEHPQLLEYRYRLMKELETIIKTNY